MTEQEKYEYKLELEIKEINLQNQLLYIEGELEKL